VWALIVVGVGAYCSSTCVVGPHTTCVVGVGAYCYSTVSIQLRPHPDEIYPGPRRASICGVCGRALTAVLHGLPLRDGTLMWELS
jgi:hypothetical protein